MNLDEINRKEKEKIEKHRPVALHQISDADPIFCRKIPTCVSVANLRTQVRASGAKRSKR
eukprot:scaffold104587_cov44-Cyclotella_meneghiniana.AAC.2